MTPTIRYPSGPVTPAGAYHILRDRIPQVTLTAYDESIRFDLMGGLAIPDRTVPERVELKDLKGLVPPWQTIDQKGATEDGITFIDALYDPIEVEMEVVCHGRNPAYCRKVGNHLISSLDAKQESRLSWFTHRMGYWWAPVRWFKTPASGDRPASKRQGKSLRLRADSGFWQSYPSVDQFSYTGGGPGTQSAFLRRINAGDQEMWDRYTCFGPGTFYFGNGPGSGDMVKFGPLLAGQVAQVRTDPRKYGVKDLTLTPSTPNQQASQTDALSDLLSFITLNPVTHVLDVLQSFFGLLGGGSAPVPPQGNLYRLLQGRFSNPIPAKSPGNPAKEYFVKVAIEGGNANSVIIGVGTPMRRYPY